MLRYEWKKLLFYQKGALYLMALLFAGALLLAATDTPKNSSMEQYREDYEWYLEKLEGACTKEAAEFLDRIGEILGVDYTKDIDYKKQTLKVYFRDDNDNEARAKNAEYRSAKISRETFEFLLHYLAEYRRLLQRQTLLFINIRGDTAGKPMRVESVYDMLERMEKKTGIKLTPHMLRRYYAVSRRSAGWALELIQLALGHKHLDTTVKYLGILDDQLMDASREFYEKHSELYGIKELL